MNKYVKNIIDTTWGDQSTERDFFCNFLGFQMYAEHMYNEEPTYEEIQHRCDFCIKEYGARFVSLLMKVTIVFFLFYAIKKATYLLTISL